MASTVVLSRLTSAGRAKTVEKVSNVDVDALDEDGCFELLRRMAKKNGLKAADCEIRVQSGRHDKTYRV